MNDPGQRHDVSNPTISAAIARVRAQGAESSTDAVLVGNRAGIVEWTNAAWSQTTGFPQHETIQKPISHFLDVSGIELELVDFVGRHFIEGRRCTIEFPFETFDDREIQVHLEVESIRNEAGEIDAIGGQTVQNRSIDVLIAAHAHVPPTLVVGENEEDVWFFSRETFHGQQQHC